MDRDLGRLLERIEAQLKRLANLVDEGMHRNPAEPPPVPKPQPHAEVELALGKGAKKG